MKLTVNKSGVWLDDQKINGCTQVDVKNINPIEDIEVLLHLTVDEVDIQYHSKEILRKTTTDATKLEQSESSTPLQIAQEAFINAFNSYKASERVCPTNCTKEQLGIEGEEEQRKETT